MYDSVTERLIQDAPSLDDLDTDELPRLLAAGFAEVVKIRLRLRDDDHDDEDARLLLDKLQRLASTYETYAVLLPDRDNTASAAFVAATAHRLLRSAANGNGNTHFDIHGELTRHFRTLSTVVGLMPYKEVRNDRASKETKV